MGQTRKDVFFISNSSKSSRSWFCVLNNPQNLFGDMTPEEMVSYAIDLWIDGKPHRTCAVNYEIGDTGNHHMHMVLEDPAKSRFSAVQKLFPGIHIEETHGSKEQAENYILKKGQFEEKNHTVIVPAVFHGSIKASQGSRNDLEIIEDLIEQGKNPNEILDISINYRKYETFIRKHFFAKRKKQTPIHREISVYWHTGESGSGKSYSYVNLCKEKGEENIYLLTDYENGGFDDYCGEPVLFMDEFKGNIKFQQLLNYLDSYRCQIHCRYANCYALWNEVHITSVFTPDTVYKNMVDEDKRNIDKVQQLLRRITSIIYHYKDKNGNYCSYAMPISRYTNKEDLVACALSDKDGFMSMDFAEQTSFPFID